MALDATKRAAGIIPTPAEQELLASLRNVIGERPDGSGEVPEKTKPKTKAEGKAPFSFLQFVFIIALALDLSLIYVYVLDLFPGVEQNTVIPRLAQLLPIVGGTLLVSYLDQIRAWVLGFTAKKSFGLGCILVLPLLLAFQMRFYTLFVDLHPATAHVQIMEKDKFNDAEFNDTERHFLKLKKPLAYRVRIDNEASEYPITALQVLKGTLARWRWLGVSPLRLEVLHEVNVSSPQPSGRLEVLAPDTLALHLSKLTRSPAPVPGCADSSGSGTAQSCSTTPRFTPSAGKAILYKTTTPNTDGLTINVNSSSTAHVRKWRDAAFQALAAGDLPANTPVLMVYDGTYWNIGTILNAPSGGSGEAVPPIYFWSEAFSGDNSPSIRLPAGKYVFVLTVDGCHQFLSGEVPMKEEEQVDFLTACNT
jgi:hypothetical protein